MVTFRETEAQLVPSQIEAVEKFVGLSFPKEYKEHLLRYNGGRCSPSVFNFVENGEETSSAVDWFFSIYDGEYDNLVDYINIYKKDKERLPVRMLPIAHDSGGNLVCISCSGADEGKVFFWDHEKEDLPGILNDEYANMYLVANSFTQFLNELH
jgi:hypothetical protein